MEAKGNAVTIPLAIVAAGAMIAVAVYFSGGGLPSRPGSDSGSKGGSQLAVIDPVTSADHLFGNANANVVVVEYSDLECPFCKTFHDTMHQVVSSYGGKVAWVYRQFPIAELHSKASKESEASECAAELGGNTAFWSFIDKVFATTGSNNSLDPAELPKIAQSIGLDVAKFNQCLSSGKYAKQIEDSVAAAIAAGAEGTPYSLILLKSDPKKQIVINGAEPFGSVKAKIDSLLK